MARAVRCAAALAGAVAAMAQWQRVSVPLDLGWRFHLGDVAAATCSPLQTFPINYTGLQFDGLRQADGAVDAASCEAACCGAASCQIWQWCPVNATGCGPAASCWIGMLPSGPGNKAPAWVSFGTNATVPAAPAAANTSFPDSDWELVDIPHDGAINGTFSANNSEGQAFLPHNVSWYRHHFNVPSAWQGKAVYAVIENAISVSQWWVNGGFVAAHDSAYTPVIMRLDNGTVPLVYGGNATAGSNVLAGFVDATAGVLSGWWCEGSGLTRHAALLALDVIHLDVKGGVFAPSYSLGAFTPNGPSPADGLTVEAVVVRPVATVVNDGIAPLPKGALSVTWTLVAADGVTVLNSTTQAFDAQLNVSQSVSVIAGNPIVAYNAQAWSVPRPYLHTVVTTVSVSGAVVDSVNTTVGFRRLRYDADNGLFVNDQPVKQRGACDHDTFGGVGAAVTERINMLRVQTMRGMGMNSRRTSHNPPPTGLLDLTDRLGVLVLDENRVFQDDADHLAIMQDHVLRDRNRASVISWSFCNEVGCGAGGSQPTEDYKQITYLMDGTRPVTGNMCAGWGSCSYPSGPITELLNMSIELDVQGFSHVGASTFQQFHELAPDKPLHASECCSCETQRGEDADQNHTADVYFATDNAPCLAEQINAANLLPYVTGSYVWTAHDYFGEPGNWPHISSSFGAVDLTGVPKPPAWWYRSWWLANVSATDAGRPPLANTSTFVRIVESWAPSNKGLPNRTIHVLTNAPQVALTLNGNSVAGGAAAVPQFGQAVFSVPYAPGSLTATAMDASGNALATHVASSWGAPAKIVLTVDAPSPATGTGARLYADGGDTALVRATIVDANGAVCNDASINITFAVAAGPGLIVGTGSGNPSDHLNVLLPLRTTYHGIARAVVRVSLAATGSDADRALLAVVNPEAGAGPRSSSIMAAGGTPPTSITVSASAAGLPGATVDIPLSTDPADSVLAVAAASVALAAIGE